MLLLFLYYVFTTFIFVFTVLYQEFSNNSEMSNRTIPTMLTQPQVRILSPENINKQHLLLQRNSNGPTLNSIPLPQSQQSSLPNVEMMRQLPQNVENSFLRQLQQQQQQPQLTTGNVFSPPQPVLSRTTETFANNNNQAVLQSIINSQPQPQLTVGNMFSPPQSVPSRTTEITSNNSNRFAYKSSINLPQQQQQQQQVNYNHYNTLLPTTIEKMNRPVGCAQNNFLIQQPNNNNSTASQQLYNNQIQQQQSYMTRSGILQQQSRQPVYRNSHPLLFTFQLQEVLHGNDGRENGTNTSSANMMQGQYNSARPLILPNYNNTSNRNENVR